MGRFIYDIMLVFIVSALSTAILLSCDTPGTAHSAPVTVAKGATTHDIDTSSESSSKKAEARGKNVAVTYNDYDPRLMAAIVMIAIFFYIMAILMDSPKSDRIKIILGIAAAISLISAIVYLFFLR